MSQSPDGKTLREKLSESDKLARELIHHLESGFIPKVHGLRRTARHGNDPAEQDEITDATIRNQVETVLESHDFGRKVADQLRIHLDAIDREICGILKMG